MICMFFVYSHSSYKSRLLLENGKGSLNCVLFHTHTHQDGGKQTGLSGNCVHINNVKFTCLFKVNYQASGQEKCYKMECMFVKAYLVIVKYCHLWNQPRQTHICTDTHTDSTHTTPSEMSRQAVDLVGQHCVEDRMHGVGVQSQGRHLLLLSPPQTCRLWVEVALWRGHTHTVKGCIRPNIGY